MLVEDINTLEISPLSSSDVIRKILHSLHKPKYNIVTSLLYEKEINTLEVGEVEGRVRSHEMFLMGEIEPPQVKGDLALKAKGEQKSKKSKGKAPQTSSSEAIDDSSDDDSDNNLSPRDLKLHLDEYNEIIKKLKSKLKCLKNVHVELKTSHDELFVRHNEVVL